MTIQTTQIPAGSSNRAGTMSRRTIAVVVGILFFVQMLTAMFGTSMIQSFVDGDTTARPTLGVLLMMCSGLAVVGIGLLMYQVLKGVNRQLAFWYPVLRIVEFIVSAACGVYLLSQLQVVPNHLLWVYIPTGIGGLILTYLLFVSRLVPRSIAVLGLVGYATFLVAVPLDLLGVLNMNEGMGMLVLAPGGLFEFVFMPIWLIAKGFGPPSTVKAGA
jgi:Na+-driven multidrug efflux pump